jgi:hypothetical protein
MRRLGLGAEAISRSLRMRLGLDTGEIAKVLAHPITPPEGIAVAAATTAAVDLTSLEVIDARDAPEGHLARDVDRRRASLAASEPGDPSH